MNAHLPTRYPNVASSDVIYVSHNPQKMIVRTNDLDVYEEVAYRRVVDQILMSADRLEDNDKRLGYATKLGKARWLKVKAVLVGRGLLQVVDGRITSPDCQEQLARVELQIAQKSRAGKASAEVRAASPKPLKNKETASTAVTLPVATAVGTKYELSKEEDDNAREAVALERPTKPPSADQGQWEIVQAMTDAVVAAYGVEVGGYNRAFTPGSDWLDAAALLKTGSDLGLSEPETVGAVRDHLFEKCRSQAQSGRRVPTAVSWFVESAARAVVKAAEKRARAQKGFAGSHDFGGGQRPRYTNGADAPTAVTTDRPWQLVQRAFVSARLFDPAKDITEALARGGDAEANRVAAALEAEHLRKKPAAAARAA